MDLRLDKIDYYWITLGGQGLCTAVALYLPEYNSVSTGWLTRRVVT
jgi:hypothetical protein